MKKNLIFLFLSTALLFCYSCKDDDKDNDYRTYKAVIQLVYPQDSELQPKEGIAVTLYNSANSTTYDATTDETGKAVFTIPTGIYDASTTDSRSNLGKSFILNGVKSNITITPAWVETDIIEINIIISERGGIVIKEIYFGGCLTDDGSGTYNFDQYIILYNNSSTAIDMSTLALAIAIPANAQGTNNDYVNDKLFYEAEGWIPGGMGMWEFTNRPILEPEKQLVIAVNNAIDNTVTYSNSINFANPEYYCNYDPESGFNNVRYYSSPSNLIPTSHYLKAYRLGTSTAWVLSHTSPAFYIFSTPEGTTLESFITDAGTDNAYGNSRRKKVPTKWIIDGIEVFRSSSTNNKKRLTSAVDAGYINFTFRLGYSLYRNVDVEATKAIEGNEAKLVYNYNLGTEADVNGTTDKSGIDAEASIKNGARIIYLDTNNSSNDFHQRRLASLRN